MKLSWEIWQRQSVQQLPAIEGRLLVGYDPKPECALMLQNLDKKPDTQTGHALLRVTHKSTRALRVTKPERTRVPRTCYVYSACISCPLATCLSPDRISYYTPLARAISRRTKRTKIQSCKRKKKRVNRLEWRRYQNPSGK